MMIFIIGAIFLAIAPIVHNIVVNRIFHARAIVKESYDIGQIIMKKKIIELFARREEVLTLVSSYRFKSVAEGIAITKNRIYMLNEKEDIVYVYDRAVKRIHGEEFKLSKYNNIEL